ncbi:hypothetical protein PIROE2DRAFT_4179 [Piromyces sp. E2]|nr:hypothetical protein PIROE2DRAFT_4179 [Piromyces sp. E2]|eukprot:OUM68177.1 hypothetical protein PIROE2DRAFT_4179 [Piromyces sp. E2]
MKSETIETPIKKINPTNNDDNTTDNPQIKDRGLQIKQMDNNKNSNSVKIENSKEEPENLEFSKVFKKKISVNKGPPIIKRPSTSNEDIVEEESSSPPPQIKSDTLSPTNTLDVTTNKKSFDKSTSSIQIDNNVDFTVIKMNNNNKENNNKEEDTTSNNTSKKEKKRNKVNDDLEILNVDDIEQTEGNLLSAQKPLGYKGDYYTLNQELTNKNNNTNNNTNNNNNNNLSLEGKTEDYISNENDEEEDPNEPKVITNSFFTEDENFKLKKKTNNKFFRSNSKSKKNDIVVIKNNSLINSQQNSSNSLECDISDIPDHGKPNRNNNNSMTNNDDNANTHPFSVF